MFRNSLLISSIVVAVSACGGSSQSSSPTPPSINASNAVSTTKAVLQQVTGVTNQVQMAAGKKSTSSSKSTAQVGVNIESSASNSSILDINFLTEVTPSCDNSGQGGLLYVVNSDITLDCDFVVLVTSQLEVNDSTFFVNGNLSLSNAIATGISTIATEGGIFIITGEVISDGELSLTAVNGNFEVYNTAGVESAIISNNDSFTLSLLAISNESTSLSEINLEELLNQFSTLSLCESNNQLKSQISSGSSSSVESISPVECANDIGTGITIAKSFSDLLISTCLNNEGVANFNYDDNNSNGVLDQGDTSHADYKNCKTSDSLNVDGQQAITVTEFILGYKAKVINKNFTIVESGKTSTSNGSISLSASDANGVQRFRSEFNEYSETVGIETITLHSGFIETRFENAKYEMEQNTVISGTQLAGKLTISTSPSLKGNVIKTAIQPPSSGKLKATAVDGSYIIIDADDGDDNADTFNLTVSNGVTVTTVQKWSEL